MARPGYEAVAVRASALGDEYVRGTSPVSLGSEETMTIHTVCVIHSAEGGWNYLWETVSKHRKRSQVRISCGHCEIHLHPVESSYMPLLVYYWFERMLQLENQSVLLQHVSTNGGCDLNHLLLVVGFDVSLSKCVC